MPSIQEQVYRFLQSRPGENITVSAMAEEVDLNGEQINNAAWRLLERYPALGLVRVASMIYRYEPERATKSLHEAVTGGGVRSDRQPQPVSDDRIFCVLRAYDDGRVILESDGGELYVAQRLETPWS